MEIRSDKKSEQILRWYSKMKEDASESQTSNAGFWNTFCEMGMVGNGMIWNEHAGGWRSGASFGRRIWSDAQHDAFGKPQEEVHNEGKDVPSFQTKPGQFSGLLVLAGMYWMHWQSWCVLLEVHECGVVSYVDIIVSEGIPVCQCVCVRSNQKVIREHSTWKC